MPYRTGRNHNKPRMSGNAMMMAMVVVRAELNFAFFVLDLDEQLVGSVIIQQLLHTPVKVFT